MARRAKVSLAAALVAATLALAAGALVSCKPITYYLQQVYKVCGTVTDAQTGEPLESVEVFIQSYQYSELTNGLGDYELELAFGTWRLVFVRSGYETETRDVSVDSEHPRVRADVAMSPPAPPPPPPPPGGLWFLGYWVQATVTAPHSVTLEVRADGTFTMWNDYLASDPEDIETYGTWSLEDDMFSVVSTFGSSTVQIDKVSDDQWVCPGPGDVGFTTWYRRGTEPGGWVFDRTPMPLAAGTWTESEVEYRNMDLYCFTAPAAGHYAVEYRAEGMLDPWGVPYTGHYACYVYASDQMTELSADWEDEEGDLDAVAMNPGELIYVIADGDEGGGTYGVRVVQVQ